MDNIDQKSGYLKNNGPRRYIKGFDGLRVLALLGVIFYHLMPYSVPGGYLGVPIFFAISGYLITDLFIQEWDRTQKINIRSFYIRRLKRLYPTLVTVLVASVAYMTLFAHNLMAQIRSVVFTNLVFLYNWWQVGHGQSYFDRYNGESPFTHLWYLSVLAQYYILWPLIMWLLLKFIKKRSNSAGILLGGAIASALLMAMLFTAANTNRVYYGTDTRFTPFLLGAALAFVWPSTRLSRRIDQQTKLVVNSIGGVFLLIMIMMCFKLAGTSSFTYHGGMFIFSVLSVLMVGIIAHPAFSWDKWLDNPVFSWLGSRSYAIYMYQFPVMIFYEQAVTNIAAHPILNMVIPLVIIFGLSELSYRFMEVPLAKFDYREIPQFFQAMVATKSKYGWKRWLAIPIIATFGVMLFGMITAPAANRTNALQHKLAKDTSKTDKKNEAVLKKQREKQQTLSKYQDQIKQLQKAKKIKLTKNETAISKKYGLSPLYTKSAASIPLTGVGDSILADTADDLQSIFPNGYMSAKVGRQVWDAPEIINQYKSKGQLSDNVLINLGTNSPLKMNQIDAVMKAVGSKRRIFWVNVHVPTQTWESEVNTTLNKAAKKYNNLTIVDWYQASLNQTNWFYGDHVHPNTVGSQQYAKIIATKIVDTFK